METDGEINANVEEGRTSPSQLEEVTLDADSSFQSMGMRSPLMGARGRSIKDVEDQLSGLRKENFNLKLRIYFLEERMGNNYNYEQETFAKKHIETMVELEGTRKEVQEKQDLLCQAVKAMELEEEEHRKEVATKDKTINELQRQVSRMQNQLDVQEVQEEEHSADASERDYFAQVNSMHEEHQAIVTQMEQRIADLDQQAIQLRANKANPVKTSDASTSADIDVPGKLTKNEEKLQGLLEVLDNKCSGYGELQNKMEQLQSDFDEKSNEYILVKRKLEQKTIELVTAQLNLADALKTIKEKTEQYDNECRRSERTRVAISNRNAKITELEDSIETYKAQIADLQRKLDAAANEVKSKLSPSASRRPPPKSLFTDGQLLSVQTAAAQVDYSPASKALINKSARLPPAPSPNSKSKSVNTSATSKQLNASGDEALELNGEDIRAELARYQHHISKLEQDQLKACRIIQTMLETRKKNSKEIEELQQNLQQRDTIISEMRAQLGETDPPKTVAKSIQERVSELNLTAAAPSSDTELSTMGDENDPSTLLEQYKQFTTDLETQKQILMDTLKEKDAQMDELEKKYEELHQILREKDDRIVDLEFELLSAQDSQSDKSSVKEKADTAPEKISFWIKESEDKDREIEKLEKELAQRTYDLQGVVNKELWQKNREIERLQKHVTGIEKKDLEIGDLKKQVTNYENVLKVYRMRLSEFESLKLQEKLNNSNEDRNDLLLEVDGLNRQVDELTMELKEVREELRLNAALRMETQEVCVMLGQRLEELAQFLDKLLKQKAVLGFLGVKENKLMRQRIEESLDLSKNLSITLQMNSEQSLLQLSNISDLLNATRNDTGDTARQEEAGNLSIVPDNISVTYQTCMSLKGSDDQSEVIRVLRSQVEKLKEEIEVRDRELAQRMSLQSMRPSEFDDFADPHMALSPEEILQKIKSYNGCEHSDSESWSEPDRSVSKARIGLDDECLKPKVKMVNESTDARPTSARTPSKKIDGRTSQLVEQISQLEQIVRDKDDLLSVTTEKQIENEVRLAEMSEHYNQLAERAQHLDARFLQVSNDYQELKRKYDALMVVHDQDVQKIEEDLLERETLQKEHDKLQKERDFLQDERIALQKEQNSLQKQCHILENERDTLQSERDKHVTVIKELESNLRAALDDKCAAENEIVLLNGKIENLESYKTMLVDSMDTKTKFIQNRINELEVEKSQAQHDAKAAEAKLDEATKEIGRITDKLLTLEIKHAKSASSLITDAEKEVQRRVKEAEDAYNEQLRVNESNANAAIQKMREASEKLALKYENDYVEKTEVERLKHTIRELEAVQEVLKFSEQKVKQLESNEMTLKQELFECESTFRAKINELRREMDAVTFQYSQLQLEKARVEEDKIQLQHQTKLFTEREDQFEAQVADLKQEFAQLKDNFNRQIAAIEAEKSHMEVKVSSLEMLNADLQNQIVKMQCSGHESKTHSAPPTPKGRILDMYLAKNQHYCNAYRDTPIHCIAETLANFKENIHVQAADVERFHANSSPDLGIESDQGRFSSLEANVVPVRPLAQSIDLAATMSENLEKNQRLLSISNCNNDNCVRNVKEVHNENHQLKKRLNQSNKLLEETLSQLAKANRRKQEVEKNICKQIHKTSQVLKIAKANLDSGSESELTPGHK